MPFFPGRLFFDRKLFYIFLYLARAQQLRLPLGTGRHEPINKN
jgi:hypothetical protein